MGQDGGDEKSDDLVWSQPGRGLHHFDEKSAFRPCGRELVEFSKSTGWALYRQMKGKHS
jgi:hypothetical protein